MGGEVLMKPSDKTANKIRSIRSSLQSSAPIAGYLTVNYITTFNSSFLGGWSGGEELKTIIKQFDILGNYNPSPIMTVVPFR